MAEGGHLLAAAFHASSRGSAIHTRNSHGPLKTGEPEIRFIRKRRDDRPRINVAVNDSLGVQKVQRLGDPQPIRPDQAPISRKPRLSYSIGLVLGPAEDLQRGSLARIDDDKEPGIVFLVGEHGNEKVVGARNCRQTLELPYLTPPD